MIGAEEQVGAPGGGDKMVSLGGGWKLQAGQTVTAGWASVCLFVRKSAGRAISACGLSEDLPLDPDADADTERTKQ